MASDLLGLKSSGDLFIGILQSQSVEDDVINKFNLRKVYWDHYIEDSRKDLTKYTDLKTDRKSGIVTIQVTDRDPKRAAAIAQEYISELNRVVVTLNTSTAHREREFLEQRLDQVKQELESAENGFGQFASQNTALDIPAEGKAMIEASADVEGELIASETELQSLRQIYADGNVRVRSLQARVDELQRQLQKLGGKYDSSTNQADQPFYPSIKKLPLLGVKYADLYRKETPSVKVLDPPKVPEKKSYPPRMAIVVLGTLFSASLGVVWIFGNAVWAEVDPHDPNKILVLEVSQATRSRLPWIGANGSGNGDHRSGNGDH
jgi:capsule polysaccharide export protein KpsE/RkpR